VTARDAAHDSDDGSRTDAHVPVLLAEVLEALATAAGEVFADATYGDGGYTRALLGAADCRVVALDRDPDAVQRASDEAKHWDGRLTVVPGRFGDMGALLPAHGFPAGTLGGVAMDLGLSSLQLGDPARGFSFRDDGPLDMRMTPEGPSAADVVNTLPEDELAGVLSRLGGERFARRIAGAMAEARGRAPIQRTHELADLVAHTVPPERRTAPGAVNIHPATRTFQALRIYVNDELVELRRGLAAAELLLAPHGRLAVVSFHSLEDREVKRFLTTRSGREPRPSRHAPPTGGAEREPSFRVPERPPRAPSAAEVAANPRARSAKLRWGVRTEAPAWGLEAAA
jgi:16S rRNA (cytosine1402-N4)-methyltransferase